MDSLPSQEELDKLDETGKIDQKKIQEEYKKRDQLIHLAFFQSPPGKEWLEKCKEQWLVNIGCLKFGESHDPYDIGWLEGRNDVIRKIIKTIAKVNKGD